WCVGGYQQAYVKNHWDQVEEHRLAYVQKHEIPVKTSSDQLIQEHEF
ncbi:20457_t:CDS:1, partial [Rhizophagus irregularis]